MSEDTPTGTEPSENDVLVEIRGEGRYFGTESSEPVCRRCHQRGHIAVQCKTVVCDNCGQHDDHYTKQCPKSQRCTNCGEFGHLRKACKNRRKVIFCSNCHSRIHTEETCPLIWRQYKTAEPSKIVRPPSVSCYNCAEQGHYGDDCPKPRRVILRYREDSAFKGDNLPRQLQKWYDESRRMSSSKRKRDTSGHKMPKRPKSMSDLPSRPRNPPPPLPKGPRSDKKRDRRNKDRRDGDRDRDRKGSNKLVDRIKSGTARVFKRRMS
uniref:ARAD1B23991p n=1 Tax=Blastobotrys adeninivorans TaxID=409370 RepID=A0A060T7Z0_BLAAD